MGMELYYLKLFNDIKFKIAMHTFITIALLIWFFISNNQVLLELAIIYYALTMSVFPLRIGGMVYTNKKLILKRVNKRPCFNISDEVLDADNYYGYRIIGLIDDPKSTANITYLSDTTVSEAVPVDKTSSKLKKKLINGVTTILLVIYMTFY